MASDRTRIYEEPHPLIGWLGHMQLCVSPGAMLTNRFLHYFFQIINIL